MVAVGNNTETESRTRVEELKTIKRMAKLVGITRIERLDEIRTPYEPAPRDIPSDETIAAVLLNLDRDHRWAWPTWAIRSIRRGLNASGCAKTMGHRLDIHSTTDHREFAKSDLAAMAAQLKSV